VKRDPLDTCQYKVFMILDYSETESVFIVKWHHCMADGIMGLIAPAMMERRKETFYDDSKFIKTGVNSMVMKVLQYVGLPWTIYLAQKSVFDFKVKNNEVYQRSKGPKLTGEKRAGCSAGIDIAEVLDKSKKCKGQPNSFTINDYIMSILIMTFREFIKTEKKIHVSVPFTLRPIPLAADMKTDKDFPIYNDFACVPLILDLVRDFAEDYKAGLFKEVMRRMKAQTRSKKFQGTALGWDWLMKSYFMAMIKPLLAWQPWKVMTGFTAIFSTVPGPITPYIINRTYNDKSIIVRRLYYFVPGAARMALSISALTHAGELKVGILCDTSYFGGDATAHKKFLEIYEQKFLEHQQHI